MNDTVLQMPETKVSRLKPMPYGEGEFDSGANPDFQETSASRNEREMKLLLSNLSAKSNLVEKRLAHLDKAAEMLAQKRASLAPVEAEADPVVIEPFNDTERAAVAPPTKGKA